jgi:hypothetical protein
VAQFVGVDPPLNDGSGPEQFLMAACNLVRHFIWFWVKKMKRRLEDRIRQLCALAVVTDNEKLEPIIAELTPLLGAYAARTPYPVEAESRSPAVNSTEPAKDP